MKKRELGTSGLFVSELGLGGMSLPNTVAEVKMIIDTAIHAGINFIDTADLYEDGKNEELIGMAIKENRDKIILATKVGNKMNTDRKSWSWNPSAHHIKDAVKKSLKRLGTDYIDLYQLHGGTMEDDVDETIDAFESLKKEGLIRQYGISSIRPNVIKRFLEKGTAVSVMMQYSLLDRRPEEWFPQIEMANASVITRGTVAKGLLTAEGPTRAKSTNGFADYDALELKRILAILAKEATDLHTAAITFTLRSNAVSTALVGARSKEQLLDSIVAYEKGISTEELEKLAHLVPAHKYKEHRL